MMPPIDLNILKASQTEAARARLALNTATAKLNDTRTQLQKAETALADAARLQMDAPADVPLLLMPVRLETRFATVGRRAVLRIRIYPDDIHMDLTDPGLSPDEDAAARQYWTDLFRAPDDGGIDVAWVQLKNVVGRGRARLVARLLRPTNADARGSGAAPVFPQVGVSHKAASQPRLLPDRFRVTAWQDGRKLRAEGAPVDPALKVGLLADDGSRLVDHDGLKVLEGTEWLSDYDKALAAGMAIDLPLPNARTPIERLYVYGVCQTRKPSEAAAELASLFAAHDGGPGLTFVPQGTPSNNTEGGSAGWQRWREPVPLAVTPQRLPADANGAVMAAALGLGAGAAVLADAPHADDREAGAAGAMNAALWPATWGYFLETLDQGEKALTPQMVEDLRLFHAARVRGRGALPALMVGDQPYGVLTFAGFAHHFKPLGAGTTETALDGFLRNALPNWLNAVKRLPRIDAKASAATVLTIYGQAPVSWGVRARKCLAHDFLNKVAAASDQAKEATEVEALLTQLLAESLGGFSYVYGPGSLATDSRPVTLPYADPKRDAGYIKALLDGASPGEISSVFQALIGLGYKRLKLAATPSPRTAEALRATATLGPALTEQVIGAVTTDHGMAASEIDRLQAQVMAAAPAGLFVSAEKFRPMALARDAAEVVIAATSVAERDRVGIGYASTLLRSKRQLADMTAGLRSLLEIAASPIGADFTGVVAETLDTASHRLDAWITGLSAARLERMRATKPDGLTVGAFGWLLDLAPQNRAKPEGGYIAAPALEHATTAGLLRSAYLAHNPSDGSGGAFAINLSSARVRRALALIEGVANGQTLGALLGYAFERRLHDADCDRFILTFRGIAPLRAGQLTDAGSPTTDAQSQAVSGVNVVDMLHLLTIWGEAGQGEAVVMTKLAQRPEANEYLAANVVWKGPTAAQKKAIETAVADAADDADAIADLLMAESVHQLAQGNMARASAALDASGKGEAPPPDSPDVVQTTGPGTIVTHRLIAALPDTDGWGAATPRAQASPALESWAAARLPAPGKVVLGPASGGGMTTLAAAGLGALDFAALCRHPDIAARVIRARAPLANPEAALLAPGAQQIPQDSLAFAEAVLNGAALQDVMESARVLTALSIGLPGAAGWGPAPGAEAAALTRIASVAGMLQARLAQLEMLMAGDHVQRADLMAALLDLTDFGIILPDLTEQQVADLAQLALAEGTSRLARLQSVMSEAPSGSDGVAAAAAALFGPGFHIPLPHVFVAVDPGEALGERAVTAVKPGEAERYLADCGTVRPAVGQYQRLNLLAGITGRGPALVIKQLCGVGDDPPDNWIGAGLPGDRRSPSGVVVSILADAPGGLDLTEAVSGLLIDDWTEIMAKRAPLGEGGPMRSRTTAGVAIHADAPGAEPPQSLILAISPDGERWTEDKLCDFLTDTLDLAQARLVTLETLPLAARTLPAIYTQSWSLQGEEVINWSKILLETGLLAKSEGLKNFTMLKEV